MTPTSLKLWRKRLALSQGEAAARLGLSLRGFQNYESGVRFIPKPVTLACAAIALGVTNYEG